MVVIPDLATKGQHSYMIILFFIWGSVSLTAKTLNSDICVVNFLLHLLLSVSFY